MSAYRRYVVIGLVVGPMILLGFFAWSTMTTPVSSRGGVAADAVGLGDDDGRANEDVEVKAEAPAGTATTGAVAGENPNGRLRPLPRAEGLPEPSTDVIQPIGVRIADVDVDGEVVAVGVEADGSFEVPSAREVGWYRFGSNAGEPGSTVLAAHISYDGVDGVFRHLASVSPGASVEVVMADGALVEYRIVEVVEYDKIELPVELLFSESGDDRLALITCGGTFNPGLRSYESNVVAYAEPVTG